MKKAKRMFLSIMMLACMAMPAGQVAQAAELGVVPFYVGVASATSSLSISTSGSASCSGTVRLQSGHVTVTLKRDGSGIKTWTASGSGTVKAGGTYNVTKNHTYVVTTTAKVYDANGKLVDTVTKNSAEKSY